MTTRLTQVEANNDVQYGCAANGRQVGSGFDCEIKRESRTAALVNVMTPNGDGDWITVLDVDPDTDLQELAVSIARCPEFGDGGYVTIADDLWWELCERWNAIDVRRS